MPLPKMKGRGTRTIGAPTAFKILLCAECAGWSRSSLMAHLMLQPLHFILETQLLTLPFRDFEIVRRWSSQLFFDFAIESTMLLRQLNEVCVKRHIGPP